MFCLLGLMLQFSHETGPFGIFYLARYSELNMNQVKAELPEENETYTKWGVQLLYSET